MADDQYGPIEVDPSDPRVHLADGPAPPAQEPLPAVPGPFARAKPQTRQAPSQGVQDVSWGPQYQQRPGRKSGKTVAMGNMLYSRYPPPGPDWQKYGPPAIMGRIATDFGATAVAINHQVIRPVYEIEAERYSR